MEIEVINKRENKLLNRIELDVVIKHAYSGTPSRMSVREAIASKFNVALDNVYVIKLLSEYGIPVSRGHIHIYNSKDYALQIEPEYIIRRNIGSTQQNA
ncbi:MAG: 30S ribosomal protein S24e [archaeon YNP-WB-040]|jgi:small subunit ribosomal protein S24e|nr:30S ribosomal protein S24e [Candidatus Culexarchaeum yellowstonense]